MDKALARKRPADIVRAERLPATLETGLTATVRPVPRPEPVRQWRPDLWPWTTWGPLLCLPGILLAGLLISLAHLA